MIRKLHAHSCRWAVPIPTQLLPEWPELRTPIHFRRVTPDYPVQGRCTQNLWPCAPLPREQPLSEGRHTQLGIDCNLDLDARPDATDGARRLILSDRLP